MTRSYDELDELYCTDASLYSSIVVDSLWRVAVLPADEPGPVVQRQFSWIMMTAAMRPDVALFASRAPQSQKASTCTVSRSPLFALVERSSSDSIASSLSIIMTTTNPLIG